MICSYCRKRCKSEDARQRVYTAYAGSLMWETPNRNDWMCPACLEVARRVMRAHMAEMSDVVLAALRAQKGGKE
jgi:hypothetical protein